MSHVNTSTARVAMWIVVALSGACGGRATVDGNPDVAATGGVAGAGGSTSTEGRCSAGAGFGASSDVTASANLWPLANADYVAIQAQSAGEFDIQALPSDSGVDSCTIALMRNLPLLFGVQWDNDCGREPLSVVYVTDTGQRFQLREANNACDCGGYHQGATEYEIDLCPTTCKVIGKDIVSHLEVYAQIVSCTGVS